MRYFLNEIIALLNHVGWFDERNYWININCMSEKWSKIKLLYRDNVNDCECFSFIVVIIFNSIDSFISYLIMRKKVKKFLDKLIQQRLIKDKIFRSICNME